MEIITIGQIRKGLDNCPQKILDGSFRIYIIEGEGCILYVGKSQCAIERVMSHLGKGSWRGFWGSLFDYMLLENPKADDYTVTLYDENEIDEIVKHFGDIDSKVTTLESHLIWELSPVFNNVGCGDNKDNINRWDRLYPPGFVKA